MTTTGNQHLIRDDDFEWDDTKAANNWLANEIDFETTCEVLRDVFAIEWCDDGQDLTEQRFVTIGISRRLRSERGPNSDHLGPFGRTF